MKCMHILFTDSPATYEQSQHMFFQLALDTVEQYDWCIESFTYTSPDGRRGLFFKTPDFVDFDEAFEEIRIQFDGFHHVLQGARYIEVFDDIFPKSNV